MKLPAKYSKLHWRDRKLAREQYVEQQKGLCMHCNYSLRDKPSPKMIGKKINWSLFPKNFLKYPVHLQHNHDTDMTEGAVHAYCNAVLWLYHNR